MFRNFDSILNGKKQKSNNSGTEFLFTYSSLHDQIFPQNLSTCRNADYLNTFFLQKNAASAKLTEIPYRIEVLSFILS